MARRYLFSIAIAIAALGALGCGSTMRHMTATAWLESPGTAAAAPAAAASSGGIQSQYYITYWEGSCGWPLGCTRGDTHVKRCKVGADNLVTCVEEANASKALNPN